MGDWHHLHNWHPAAWDAIVYLVSLSKAQWVRSAVQILYHSLRRQPLIKVPKILARKELFSGKEDSKPLENKNMKGSGTGTSESTEQTAHSLGHGPGRYQTLDVPMRAGMAEKRLRWGAGPGVPQNLIVWTACLAPPKLTWTQRGQLPIQSLLLTFPMIWPNH